MLILFSLPACSYKFGILPDVSKLDKLERGVSKKVDVLMLLGEPRGRGKTRFTAAISYPFDIWFYQYTQLKGKVADFKFLLVYMEKDTYQGYLWFSTKDLVSVEGD